MIRAFAVKRMLTLFLALIMALAPVLPAFAFVDAGGVTRAIHASHDGDKADVSNHATPNPCTQHDSCKGQCCASCAQCLSAVFLVPSDNAHSHPVLTPVLNELHPFFLVASPDRPPRGLLL